MNVTWSAPRSKLRHMVFSIYTMICEQVDSHQLDDGEEQIRI